MDRRVSSTASGSSSFVRNGASSTAGGPDEPVDRRYFEVVLESGQNMCVYRDRDRRCWFTQKA